MINPRLIQTIDFTFDWMVSLNVNPQLEEEERRFGLMMIFDLIVDQMVKLKVDLRSGENYVHQGNPRP